VWRIGYAADVTGACGADAGAVLDPEPRAKGVDRLRVVDTSVMPSLVSGDTNAPAMAIAWRAAEIMLRS
jgi:choline dehydrogenase-like flavoprotein